MIVHGLVCPKCGDKVFSRAGHDIRWCGCKSVYIDGGQMTIAAGAGGRKVDLTKIRHFKAEIPQTLPELRHDWNESINKFGILPKDYPEIVDPVVEEKPKKAKVAKPKAPAKPRKKKA